MMKQADPLFLRSALLALAVLVIFSSAARAVNPLITGDLAELPEGTLIEEIVIVIAGAHAKQRVLTNLAADLIVLKQGHPLDRALLEESLDALALSTAFAEIRVQSTPTEKGHAITFTLEPLWLIRRIHVSGQFPLFEKEILNAMTVSTGDSLDMEMLQTQETLIEELYRREGFISPKVTITPRKDRDRSEMDLSIRIERGPFYAISPLTIRGNRAFGDSTLLYKMDTWWMSLMPGTTPRFREAMLKSDIRSLTEFYWKQGYPECDIDYTLTRIDDEQRAAVELSISEGPRYEVSFSGNSAFSDRALTRDLLFFSEGNRRDRMLRRSIDEIRGRYHAAGYPDVSVELGDSTATEEGTRVRRLEFTITEGERTVVESVEIVGNEAFSERSIGKQILTRPPGFLRKGRFVEETLIEDLYAVKTLYLRHGYAEALIEEDLSFSPERDRVRVSITITEGPQTLISAVNFEGLTVISEDEARAALMMKEGDPLQEYLIRSEENTLSTLISEKGYPYVQVRSQVVHSQDRTSAELFYRIEENSFVTMGNIYYRGNFKTSRSILDQEIAMEPGEPFSLKGMLEGQKSIRDMEIFNSVRFKTLGLREQAESITLLADLEEIKPYYLRSGFGYESDRGFYAQGRVGDRNIFGRNKSAWVGGEISQIGYRAESGITEPRLFGYRMLGTLGVFREKRQEFNQEFGTTVTGSTLNITKPFEPYVRTALGLRFERRNQFMSSRYTAPEPRDDDDSFKARSVLVTTPAITYDTRDSFVRPSKGFFSSLSVDISRGLENSLDNFFRYSFDLRYYVSPVERVTLAWLGRVGYIDPYGSRTTIPDDQLFYLGGTLDVRGFDENTLRLDSLGSPAGGRYILVSSVEARIELRYNFELTCFFDTGSVRKPVIENISEDFRSSVGAGLRYITPIGPIGFLYGYKLDREPSESPGRFHFSVGYTF